MGIIGIVSMSPLRILIFFISNLTCHPRTPPKGHGGLPKGPFLESDQKPGCGVSAESSLRARRNFWNFFHFWPHPSPQVPSEGSPLPPNRVISEVGTKPKLSHTAEFKLAGLSDILALFSISRVNLYHRFKLWSRTASWLQESEIWNGQNAQNCLLY